MKAAILSSESDSDIKSLKKLADIVEQYNRLIVNTIIILHA